MKVEPHQTGAPQGLTGNAVLPAPSGDSGFQTVAGPAGRTLAVQTWGDPQGDPVFLMHGTPGSRLGPVPRPVELYRRGVRLISYDRPGYGKSSRQASRRVKDAAADVESIADALGLDRFSVVGRSGGGPHALAAAALLSDRVRRVVAMVSLAPPKAENLDWYAGMVDSNVTAYQRAGRESYEEFQELLKDRRLPIAGENGDPGHLIEELNQEWEDTDRNVVADSGIRVQLRDSVFEALHHDPQAGGWVDDVVALTSDWGFQPEEIPSTVKTLLWHGQQDHFTPSDHTRWLGRHIGHATVVVEEAFAHFTALTRLPDVLTWAVSED
jgi:pimeloyl-ACP methyl ester carboxylesterase